MVKVFCPEHSEVFCPAAQAIGAMFATFGAFRASLRTERSDAPNGAPGLTTSNKKLLGAPGIATRSKDATRGSWPYY